jgi:ABC-type nitrate/sulfonate/bicarbonate transport system substrate-binding protein
MHVAPSLAITKIIEKNLSRRTFVRGAVLGTATSALGAMAPLSSAIARLEKPDLKIGAATVAAAFLPVYVAIDHTWRTQGLTTNLISFRGDPELSQALVGGSVDVAILPADAIISLVNANTNCIGFYAGFHAADFAWITHPSIKSWSGAKGTTVIVTTYGALTEQLARYMMVKNGIEPRKDIQIMAGGPPASMLQLLRAGRAQGAILAPPWKAMAQAEGFEVLATQANEVAKQWPKEIFVASARFIAQNPNAIKALLRAHVSAIRLQNANPAIAVDTLVKRLKITPEIAKITFDEIKSTFDESGVLPTQANMEAFWAMQKAQGRVTEPWPNSKILDDQFIKTFASWAP